MTGAASAALGPPAGGRRRRVTLVDADIHPTATPARISARLSQPWRTRFDTFGIRSPAPPLVYPRVRNGGMRLDAWPAEGPPGSDLPLLRKQLLDEYGVDRGILIPLQSHTFGAEAPDYAHALCGALNDWLAEEWLEPEPRLRASICVAHEAPELAAKEIRRRAGDDRFVQVLFPGGTENPLGGGKYDPIYAAAAEAGLPIAIHLGGIEAHRADGWPSFYLEQHAWYGNAMALVVTSLICGGVFERFPTLQVVVVEGGISWAGPLIWAMDAGFPLLRDDVPHLRRRPSEYLRDHFWFTTQPIEEPDDPAELAEALRHTGITDRILFASDYPHWDFDSPTMALRGLPTPLREPMMAANACRLYDLGGTDTTIPAPR